MMEKLMNLFKKQKNNGINDESLLVVSCSPHIKRNETTRSLMLDVLIALLFPLLWSVYVFGFRALIITVVCVLSCVLFEFLFKLITRKPQTIFDFSAVVTGVLLAFNLPAMVSYWIPVVGAFFAIVIVKQLFGGIGMNIMNPALAARVFLFSWPEEMTIYPIPFSKLPTFAMSIHGSGTTASATEFIASATPLSALKEGMILEEPSLIDLFIGNCTGVIGEIATLLLLAGGVYLIIRKVITWHIPVAYLGTVGIITYFFNPGLAANSFVYMLTQLFSGGLVLGAVFMATDYATSPVTKKGRLIYGVGCGLLTVLIRYYSGYTGGVSFAILIMNCLVWYIDKYTKPKVYGYVKPENNKRGGEDNAKTQH